MGRHGVPGSHRTILLAVLVVAAVVAALSAGLVRLTGGDQRVLGRIATATHGLRSPPSTRARSATCSSRPSPPTG
jgi:hypothetical protein